MRSGVTIAGAIAAFVIIALAAALAYQYDKTAQLSQSLAALQVSVDELANATTTAATSTLAIAPSTQQQSNQPAAGETAAQTLESAVAKVTPAVVSIVESKEIPRLQVSYINPFGDDPFFQGFGVRIPVYQRVGTTTRRVAAGTGFLVRANGYIVTNKHVVSDTDATYTALLSNGAQRNAEVVWRSPGQDLAILKISGSSYPSIPLGNSTNLKLGQSVFAVGNALGEYNNSVSVGVVSGLNRTVTASDAQGNIETLAGVIQTDAAINPGNSGGPLANLAGEAIGVNVAMVQGSQSIGFSIPINEIKKALSNLGI